MAGVQSVANTPMRTRFRDCVGRNRFLPRHIQSKMRLLWVRSTCVLYSALCGNVLREVCGYLHAAPVLVCWVSDQLTLFNVDTKKTESVLLRPPDFGSVVYASISDGQVIFCGGHCIQSNRYHVLDSVYLLQDARFELQPCMREGRAGSGIMFYEAMLTIYVFGGASTRSKKSSCEAFSLLRREWRRLPNMHFQRHNFSVCRFKTSVYICGGLAEQCEVFHVEKNEFALLPNCVSLDCFCSAASSTALFIHTYSEYIKYELSTCEVIRKPLDCPKIIPRLVTSMQWKGRLYMIMRQACFSCDLTEGTLQLLDIA